MLRKTSCAGAYWKMRTAVPSMPSNHCMTLRCWREATPYSYKRTSSSASTQSQPLLDDGMLSMQLFMANSQHHISSLVTTGMTVSIEAM